jgi:hypothetical protein
MNISLLVLLQVSLWRSLWAWHSEIYLKLVTVPLAPCTERHCDEFEPSGGVDGFPLDVDTWKAFWRYKCDETDAN